MKRKLLTLLFTFALFALLAISANAYIPGDTDNDFIVTAADARFALRLSVELEKCDKGSDQYKASDADNDGTITASDARKILRVSVGLESFPDHTESNLGIRITKMPYTTNGLTVNNISLKDNYFYFDVTNTGNPSDKAVAATSRIPYKMYNSKGIVIESSSVSLNQLNKGEKCTLKIYNRDNNAKLVFGSAVINLTNAVAQKETTVISGITTTKTPYKDQGITVKKITFDTEKNRMYMELENTSSQALSYSTRYNSYDAAGNSLGTVYFSTGTLNGGDKIIVYTSYNSNAKKIVYSQSQATETGKFEVISSSYKTYDSIKGTLLPLTSKGIKIEYAGISYSYSGYPSISFKVTNKTGKAVDSSSCFYIKSYDSEGYILSLTSCYLLQLNPDESCIITKDLDKYAAKFDLGNLDVNEGDTLSPGKTSVVSGITTNTASESFSGMKISDITIKKYSTSTDVTFKITNNSGKVLAYTTSLFYKAVSSDNTIVRTSTVSLNVTLNKNEFTYKTVSIPSADLAKLYFFPDYVDEGTYIPDSSSYTNVSSLKVTSAPYSSNGLTITSYRIEDGYLYLLIKNNTGTPVKDSSYFNYRIHGADGAVLRESSVFCKQMNTGETCEVKIYLYEDYAKLTFMDAKIYTVS